MARSNARRANARASRHTSEPGDESLIVEVDGFGTLTEKQRRFCLRYREHGNGTRAAIEAGYEVSERENAGDIARVLLRNHKVALYLAFLGRNDEITQGDITDLLVREGVNADHAGARVRALELVGKSRGMFADTVNLHTHAPDEEVAQAIAGDDPALKALILKRLRGE